MRAELYGCEGTEFHGHENVFWKYMPYLYSNKLEFAPGWNGKSP